ncbi:MAG: hypothetical protein WKG07_30490 [Hymenobacter sp.]
MDEAVETLRQAQHDKRIITMQIFHNPARAQWPALQQRPLAESNAAVLARAGEIFDDVARRGDAAPASLRGAARRRTRPQPPCA